MNGKAKGQRGEKKHRFHDCRTDDARWRVLAEFLDELDLGIGERFTKVQKELSTITRKLSSIMATLQQVQEELTQFRADVADERAQREAADQKLLDKIAELQALVDAGNGATPEQLDALLTDIQSIHAEMKAIVPDEPPA